MIGKIVDIMQDRNAANRVLMNGLSGFFRFHEIKYTIGYMKLIGYCHRVHAPRASWVKATETDCLNYRSALSQLLNGLTLPADTLLCADLRCHDVSHFKALNTYAQHIIDACLNAAKSCIPQTCDRQSSGRLPGWSDRVKPLRDKWLFWHRIWLDCNRPKTGVVADCMRRTRAAYRYAIRRLKKDEE